MLLAGAFGGGWLAYLRWKDKAHPEPKWIIAIAVAGGMLSVGGALLGFQLLEARHVAPAWERISSGSWPAAALTALQVGFVEELAKLTPVVIIARATARFDELLDGFVYAGSAAIGFCTVETIYLAANGLGGGELLARAVTSPITHALLSAPAGLGIAHWVLLRRPWALALGFAASGVSHGIFDLLVARSPLASAAFAGALWAWMLRETLRLEKVPPFPR